MMLFFFILSIFLAGKRKKISGSPVDSYKQLCMPRVIVRSLMRGH